MHIFRKNFLRIHDLKTGVTQTSMHQLEVYAALFCLEYNFKPENIKIELRLYQSEQVIVHVPPPEDIHRIMEKMEELPCRCVGINPRILGFNYWK